MEFLRHIPTLPSPPSSTISKKKSRLSYSITFKLAAVRHAEVHGNRSTARYLGINEKQIRDWRSKKPSLMNTNANAKRLKGAGRQVGDSKREKELKTWLEREQQQGKRLSQLDVQDKAKSLSADHHFKASSGWWRRWKIRHCYMLEKQATDIVSLNNNNNYSNLQLPTFNQSVEQNDIKTITSSIYNNTTASLPFFKSHIEGEQEFKDRITCALALLELKSTKSPTFSPEN